MGGHESVVVPYLEQVMVLIRNYELMLIRNSELLSKSWERLLRIINSTVKVGNGVDGCDRTSRPERRRQGW